MDFLRTHSTIGRPGVAVDALAGQIEMEIGRLEPADAEAFMTDLGIAESSRDRVVRPRLSGPTPKDPALLEAEAVSLRIALLPLFARTVLVETMSSES